MRTSRALRTFAATAFASGALVTASFASASPASAGNDGSVWGVVVSHRDINLRADPNPGSPKVGSLPPGARERIECATLGDHVNGNPYWYWLSKAGGWASGAYLKSERQAPMCGDNGRNHHQNQNQNQNRDDWSHRDQSGQHQDQGHDQNRDQGRDQHGDQWNRN
ncbi:SH3 domain-containing protein [Streptomyces cavernicola]|uniref:SH3 domain-containing protein n=1 Tax=Streptomyces cavernicola TaxID=3043613 RepID=A0ABT6S626_9ACTN|nr:SH3 domain-containing protein [Streptomyces sp. B-S-A6]MDI3402893.1 SH3 domain-containing protein [Streptomyces sp. B-S-A6]